ncbi:DUF4920 domain-containing protein [Planktosalinus lacus]|uniref:DUF4920 domain-containing protein n=1 Tax=Planktosalinus lacus TaxID=1526573 RepID=A0A8J2V9I3_9FLAO|nr:DUF4920 domain-containing protein [Planktosalinus lacus]GGD91850.1 hypothetical protein GCM10011312_14570 [Planktosalinus lacus]
MKNSLLILSILILLGACKNNPENQQVTADELVDEISYATFGEAISQDEAITKEEMAALFNTLKPGDTVEVKFTSIVNEVCQSKGCWMKIDLGDQETMVRFKDYGFFMPKNISGEEVTLEGKAYIEQMSIEEQRHYAEDADATDEEIAKITEPKKTLSFEAKGVLLKE